MPSYIPKGGMCSSCVKCMDDCTHLDFQSMPVIERGGWGYTVKCTEYVKDTAEKETQENSNDE